MSTQDAAFAPPTISAEQQRLLEMVHAEWSCTGKWPLYGYLDDLVDRNLNCELKSLLADLPNELLICPQWPTDHSEVQLTLLGIGRCQSGRRDVALFLRALKWCVGRQREHPLERHDPQPLRLTGQDLVADWAVGGLAVALIDVAKVFSLLTMENIPDGGWGLSSQDPTDWNITLKRGVRKYRQVETLGDYERVVMEQRQYAQSPSGQMTRAPEQLHSFSPFSRPSLGSVEPQHAGVITSLVSEEPDNPTDTGPLVLAVGDLHPTVAEMAAPLLASGQYRLAVLEAGLAWRDGIRERSGLREENDSTLVGKAFGAKPPVIVVADLTTETGLNVQRGTCHLAQAIVACIRNPLTHDRAEIPAAEAMEMLAMMSQVLRRMGNSRPRAAGE